MSVPSTAPSAAPSTAGLTLAETRRRQRHPHLDADPTYSRLVMRRLSPYLTWLIVRFTPLSADAVTFGAIGSGVAASCLVLLPAAAAYAGAALLLQFAYLCDTSDGEVARLRGTAGRRGTYLDLVGHHLQDCALWIASGYVLLELFGAAPAIVGLVLFSLAFSGPFGVQARTQATRTVDPEDPVHGIHRGVTPPARRTPFSLAYYLYRRVAFLWNYPAAMNLFCLAILADAARFVATPGAGPLVLPLFYLVYGPSRAIRHLGNAVRLFRAAAWG